MLLLLLSLAALLPLSLGSDFQQLYYGYSEQELEAYTNYWVGGNTIMEVLIRR